ncbi:hypothetical protein [Paracoccus simplex]|uniref:Uncharacterized protein n=1 Tax=Paracoccus simplex TaxID=2086346 RepID=A0ABV7S1R6_9RHOB
MKAPLRFRRPCAMPRRCWMRGFRASVAGPGPDGKPAQIGAICMTGTKAPMDERNAQIARIGAAIVLMHPLR